METREKPHNPNFKGVDFAPSSEDLGRKLLRDPALHLSVFLHTAGIKKGFTILI